MHTQDPPSLCVGKRKKKEEEKEGKNENGIANQWNFRRNPGELVKEPPGVSTSSGKSSVPKRREYCGNTQFTESDIRSGMAES